MDLGLFTFCVSHPLSYLCCPEINHPIRSQLGIQRVFFHDGIGYKYNLVCLPFLIPSNLFVIISNIHNRFNPLH
jgi:hypothetical protein